jgi:hypothetical protein
VAGQSSAVANFFSFKAPEVFTVEPTVAPVGGGQLIVVTGGNFGSKANKQVVLVGGKQCTDVEWKSEESLGCTTPPLLGAVDIKVVVGGQSSNALEMLVANAPALEGVKPLGGPCSGGTELHIAATNIPSLPVPAGVDVEVMIGVNKCTDVTVVGDGIKCMAPRGGGKAIIVVTVAGIASKDPLFYLYDAPIVDHVWPILGSTKGGEVVTVYGKNFGPFGGVGVRRDSPEAEPIYVPLQLEIGGIACKSVKRIGKDEPEVADTKALCTTMPGDGSCRNVAAVTGGNRRSKDAYLYSYRNADTQPFVQKVYASNLMGYVDGSHLSLLCICTELDPTRCIAGDLADALECAEPDLAVAAVDKTIVSSVRDTFSLDVSAPQGFILVRAADGGPPTPDIDDKLLWNTDTETREDYVQRVLAWVNTLLA